MDCELVERLISKLIDGEASDAEARRVEEHCAVCAACRGYRQHQAGVHAALDAGLTGVLAALRPRPRRRRAWRAALSAAVLALMFGAGLVGYHWPRPAAPPAPPAASIDTAAPAAPVAARPRLTVAETQGEAVRHVVWDERAGLRTLSRVDRDRIYHVAAPNGDVEIELRSRDTLYRLVGLEDRR